MGFDISWKKKKKQQPKKEQAIKSVPEKLESKKIHKQKGTSNKICLRKTWD